MDPSLNQTGAPADMIETVDDYMAKSAFAEIEKRPKAKEMTKAQMIWEANPGLPRFFRSES